MVFGGGVVHCACHITTHRVVFLRGQGKQLCHYLSLLQGYHNNQQVPFKSQSQRQRRVMTVELFCYYFTFFPTQKPKHRLVKTHSGRMFTFIINPTHCAQWSNYKFCLRMKNCHELSFSKQIDLSYCWVWLISSLFLDILIEICVYLNDKRWR